ncbi:hypothetical protein [Anaerohalosphaera lusitana]|uniref:hypothetical protein n=1 Tax=Anaerohalosphaera lusitana TaxID=1936003 RepID=UPI0011BAACD8|nr:hypothetical protein [Anaerohalosphaera lusitana]
MFDNVSAIRPGVDGLRVHCSAAFDANVQCRGRPLKPGFAGGSGPPENFSAAYSDVPDWVAVFVEIAW